MRSNFLTWAVKKFNQNNIQKHAYSYQIIQYQKCLLISDNPIQIMLATIQEFNTNNAYFCQNTKINTKISYYYQAIL